MATEMKGQMVTAELVIGVVGFAILIGVAIFVLVATTEAVPQDTTRINESLGTPGLQQNPSDFDYGVDFPPFYTRTADIEVFNGTGGQLLVRGATYTINSTSSVYVFKNATGNTTNTVRVTYTTNQWSQGAAMSPQGVIDGTNTNWNNGIQLLAVAIVVIAAGAIVFTLRTGFG